ncbi:GDSL esterase/lipase [Platanthera guangdongensis]|uniref:GDSL esterase/lipase n=1 Tax=Platanthera guangdongensis TaxID=2320717 RepID=A0ABR2LCN4_9ASPA
MAAILCLAASRTKELIKLGAKTFLVPGNFPIGCSPAALINFKNSSADDYDLTTGCINWLNEFSQNQNKQLQLELDRLRALHPHATIIYADYYTPIVNIFSNHDTTGARRAPLAACCGSGGRYNVEGPVFCGDECAIVCDDSSSYVYWDIVHMTDAANKAIACGLLEGPFADPPLKEICPHIRLPGDYRSSKVVVA